MMKRLNAAIAITLIAIGSACTEIQYHVEPLPLPSRPMLPRVTEAELNCLAPEAYARLINRERARREYAEQLETIIKATHLKE